MIQQNRDKPLRQQPFFPETTRPADASLSFGKNNKPVNRRPPTKNFSPTNRVNQRPKPQPDLLGGLPDEEPICVLKVELDGGENIQHIKVYEGQLPEDIVDDFGRKFNLSERAKFRLLE